jgi:hypothetical protein
VGPQIWRCRRCQKLLPEEDVRFCDCGAETETESRRISDAADLIRAALVAGQPPPDFVSDPPHETTRELRQMLGLSKEDVLAELGLPDQIGRGHRREADEKAPRFGPSLRTPIGVVYDIWIYINVVPKGGSGRKWVLAIDRGEPPRVLDAYDHHPGTLY